MAISGSNTELRNGNTDVLMVLGSSVVNGMLVPTVSVRVAPRGRRDAGQDQPPRPRPAAAGAQQDRRVMPMDVMGSSLAF